VTLVDLPVVGDERAVRYLGRELSLLADVLGEWAGRKVDPDAVRESVTRYNELSVAIRQLAERAGRGALGGGTQTLQEIYNRSVTEPFENTLAAVNKLLAEPEVPEKKSGVPIYLVGNVLPDPEALALFDECGARIVADDLCTGSRVHSVFDIAPDQDVFEGLARGLYSRPACARTFDSAEPGGIARQMVEDARASGAAGAIAHVMKFCDPYLARIPFVHEAMQEAGIPFLVLTGDCSLRSLGQFRTRIEAFVEMLR